MTLAACRRSKPRLVSRWLFVAGQLVCAALLLVAASAQAGDKLSPQIRTAIGAARFHHAEWGILVADRASGEVLDEFQADRRFAPASTMKLYSAAAALDELGGQFRFETPVYRRGTVDAAGVLDGDLILVAVGDPTMGGRTTAENEIEYTKGDHIYADLSAHTVLTSGNPLAGLDALARQVAEAGIRQVRGQVIVDARLFAPATGTGSGPKRLTPIMINDNLIDFTITPTTTGSRAKVNWRPRPAALHIDAQIETSAAGRETTFEGKFADSDRFLLRGRIAADRRRCIVAQEVPDPARWARTLFIESLARAGITVGASANDANPESLLPKPGDRTGLTRVALLTSPAFSENVRLILKVSHNLHANMLPLLLAVRHGKRDLADGLGLERDFFRRAGLDVDSISIGGGAGASPADLTTPRVNVALLRYMSTRPDFAIYERALPILGVDGTLWDVVAKTSPARGKVRAKTGTLVWPDGPNKHLILKSKALAGYLTAKSGRELVFSFVVNGVPIDKFSDTKTIGKVLGHLCEIVYQTH